MQETSSEVISGILVQAREEQGLSLSVVAEKLNLSEEQIEKLESEDLVVSELNAFERGYLKNYAELLGVELKSFSDLLPTGDAVTSQIHSTHDYNDYSDSAPFLGVSLIKKVFWIVLSALVVFGLYKVWPGGADVSKVAEQAFELPLEVVPMSDSTAESTEVPLKPEQSVD